MSRPATPGGFNLRRTPLPSGSGAASRSSTPLSKPVISLEEWESKAPLSDEEVQSIVLVKERFGERSLPEKVSYPLQDVIADGSSRMQKLPRTLSWAAHDPGPRATARWRG